jgi:2-polyprenyl-6-methoxyphenol hydroxylase-like FAD-dependent oxidoreductase
MSESTVVSPPQAASSADRPARPPIVIVGGGFAGIATAKALRRCDAEVTLIDRRNHHIFQPLLYQVATSVLASADVATPIRQLAASQENVSVVGRSRRCYHDGPCTPEFKRQTVDLVRSGRKAAEPRPP